jgi:hypothetical protein
MQRALLVVGLLALAGCQGPSARELKEETLSTFNVEADRWRGEPNYQSSFADAWGQGITTTVGKGPVHYTLEMRSRGPDGLPKNSDDIAVTRSWRHGESTLSKEAAKAAKEVASGAASGTMKGIKKGLGLGKEE